MLELFFSACGAGMCIALMMLIIKEFHRYFAARIFLLLIFAALVHFCHPWLPKNLSNYAYMIESSAPAFFWMSCCLIFQEGRSLPRLGLFIAIYSFTLPVLKYLIILSLGMTPDWVMFFGRDLPQFCEYALLVMGMLALLRGQGDDLVESRRRLRWAIMGASGLSLGWAVFSFNFHFGSAISRILAINVSILIIIWSIFKGRQDIWGQLKPVGNSELAIIVNKVDEVEQIGQIEVPEKSAALMQLKGMMQNGFYRQENLTLKDLAVAMNTPEYKARAIINKELGYRNFNEFINEYRIGEAAQRLLTEPETPISNIALDVGYRTLSSFNRAFRKEKETTPTAFRES